jgi:hypothetical protein
MGFENRKWVIVNNSDITDEMIASAIQTSRDTLKHTVSGTDKVILKWDGSTPSVFNGMTTYNHSQILVILNDPDGDWTSED